VHLVGIIYWNIITMHGPMNINPLNAELNPICHLLALLGDRHILHVSGLRVKKTFPIASDMYNTIIKIINN